MKTTKAPLVLSLCALALAGCADASLAKRDDGRYVVVPVNGPTGAPIASNEVHRVVPPGETGRQLSPNKDYAATTMVARENSKQQKQREADDKFEDDLANLDPK